MAIQTEWVVGALPSICVCEICSQIMEDAMMILRCQHSYCQTCILDWLSGSKTCPQDRGFSDESSLVPARLVRNAVNELQIRCPEIGCETVVSAEQLASHRKQCVLQTTQCEKCQLVLLNSERPGHDCIQDLKKEVERQREDLEEKDREIEILTKSLEERDNTIENLLNRIEELHVTQKDTDHKIKEKLEAMELEFKNIETIKDTLQSVLDFAKVTKKDIDCLLQRKTAPTLPLEDEQKQADDKKSGVGNISSLKDDIPNDSIESREQTEQTSVEQKNAAAAQETSPTGLPSAPSTGTRRRDAKYIESLLFSWKR